MADKFTAVEKKIDDLVARLTALDASKEQRIRDLLSARDSSKLAEPAVQGITDDVLDSVEDFLTELGLGWASMDATGTRLALSFYLPPAQWSGVYASYEVWRSDMGAGGPFYELTAGASLPPTTPPDYGPASALPGTGHALTGKSVQFLLNELALVSVLFTGPDPVTRAQAAAQISSVRPDLQSYVDDLGRVVVQFLRVGRINSLRVKPGDAAALLGLITTSPDDVQLGYDARPSLILGREVYSFLDPHGDYNAYYRTRYRSGSVVSSFSPAYPGSSFKVLAGRVLATLDVARLDGTPIANQELLIEPVSAYVDNVMLAQEQVLAKTDTAGHVEVWLRRGTDVLVALPGTKIVRKIHVPEDPAVLSFSLLDPLISQDDQFEVRRPFPDFYARRSLLCRT